MEHSFSKKFSKKLNRTYYTTKYAGININYFEKQTDFLYCSINVFAGSKDSVFYENGQSISLPSGIAHFLEHVLFHGEYENTINELIDKGLNINGATTNVGTYYYVGGEKKYFFADNYLNILFDIIFGLTIENKKFNEEKEIILEESYLEYNTKNYLIDELIGKLVFTNTGHENSIIGCEKDIKRTTIEDLNLFYETFYQKNNLEITFVGNLSCDDWKQIFYIFDLEKDKSLKKDFNIFNNNRNFTKYHQNFEFLPSIQQIKSTDIATSHYQIIFNFNNKTFDNINILKQCLSIQLNKLNEDFNDIYANFLQKNNLLASDIETFNFSLDNNNELIILEIYDLKNYNLIKDKLINMLKIPLNESEFEILKYSKTLYLLENNDFSTEKLAERIFNYILFECSDDNLQFNLESFITIDDINYSIFCHYIEKLDFSNMIEIFCESID